MNNNNRIVPRKSYEKSYLTVEQSQVELLQRALNLNQSMIDELKKPVNFCPEDHETRRIRSIVLRVEDFIRNHTTPLIQRSTKRRYVLPFPAFATKR